jgi:tetratricopeptide (TPR) repeat protein
LKGSVNPKAWPGNASDGASRAYSGSGCAQDGAGPSELAVSRALAAPDCPLPTPDEAAEELSTLFSVAGRYAIALYPAACAVGLGEIAADVNPSFTLEGFMPHRYPGHCHDRGETSAGDVYVFAARGETVPPPFRAPGSARSRDAIRGGPDACGEDQGILLKAVKDLASRGETAKAVPLLARLCRMRPGDARLRLNLGYFRLNVGELEPAREAFLSVLADDPANGEARRAITGILLSRRDWPALRAFLPELLIMKAVSPKVMGLWPEIRKAFLELDGIPGAAGPA